MVIGVLVEITSKSVDRIFDYLVPKVFEDKIEVGKRVKVPFSNRTLVGFILEKDKNSDVDNLKEIEDVLDDEVILTEELLELGKYLRETTLSSLISCYQVMLPKGFKASIKGNVNKKYRKVYYLNDENQFIDMRAVYKDGYMVFQTDHFSKYIVTDSPIREVLLGDINGDDLINYNDAVLVLQADSKLIELTETQRKAADVNQDGIVNYNDAVQILRKDAGLINDF